jgi:putative secretion ATPase (PEP-CTERM system associated)
MYTDFYALSEMPFQLTPDPRFFFESRGHQNAMSYFVYGLDKAEGFIVVTGEVGSGKTILIDRLLTQIDGTDYAVSQVETTLLEPEDLLRMIAAGFGVSTQGMSKATLLAGLRSMLLQFRHTGVRPLIIVDEAQNLSLPALEELRMLSNFRTDRGPGVQVVLVGQPQFRDMLAAPELEQLRQRIIATCHLRALDAEESRAYVEHRLTSAGWIGDPAFRDEVFAMVYRDTGGLPRRINLLFDRILLLGYLEESHELGREQVQQMVQEMRGEGLLPSIQIAANEGGQR